MTIVVVSVERFFKTQFTTATIGRRSFIRAGLFIQWLREFIFLFVELEALVGDLSLVLSVDDPNERQEKDSSENDQEEFEHRLVIDDFGTSLICSGGLQVGEGARRAEFTSSGDTVDADSLESPDAVGVGVTEFHCRSIAGLADALLIDWTNLAHVGFLRACDVVKGVAEVAHASEGSVVLGNPGASRISEAELRGGVGTRLGSAARNAVVVPFAVGIVFTNTSVCLGDAGDRVALVVGPSAEAIHDAVVESCVTAESVVATRVVSKRASSVAVAAESVGVVSASRSVDAQVVLNGADINVLRKTAIRDGELRAANGVDEALVRWGVPVAARSTITSCLVGVAEAGRWRASTG